MAKNLDDDEYVAELLKQDAKNAKKKYELVGIDAFNPRRCVPSLRVPAMPLHKHCSTSTLCVYARPLLMVGRANSGAPKPNKSFLRNIIRQTDRHNAALLAKEAEESRARLRTMNRERNRAETRDEEERKRRASGRLTPVEGDDEPSRARSKRRRDYSDDEDGYRRRRRSREQEASGKSSSGRHRDSEAEDYSRGKRKRSRSPYDRSHGHKGSDTDGHQRSRRRDHGDRRHRSRRSYSHTTSLSRSPPPHSDRHEHRRRHKRHDSRDLGKSPQRKPSKYEDGAGSKRRAASPASDSDPLEAIVGPLPPPPEPTVRSKGRGAFKPNSMGIESRFSSTYDPTIDVRAGSDNEDDWGDALEAMRDRARWRQQGAERLRSAGFTHEQVRKWEKGEEQTEEDVVWKGKGEAREWDRGKVLDDYGGVELKADFGRLK